jgi:hypothetical protein
VWQRQAFRFNLNRVDETRVPKNKTFSFGKVVRRRSLVNRFSNKSGTKMSITNSTVQANTKAPSSHWRQGEWLRAVLAGRKRREIGPLAVIVAMALAGFANNHTGESWYPIRKIAEEIGARVNKRGDCSAISRALTQLKAAGLLRTSSRGHMRSSLYCPIIPLRADEGDRSPRTGNDAADRRLQGDLASSDGDGVASSAKLAVHLPQGAGYTSGKVAELHHSELHHRTSPREKDSLRESCARVPRGSFERFWTIWPNPKSESKARAIFANLCRDEKTLDAIIAGVHLYIETKPYDRDWMNPITFLLQRRWEDEPAPTGKHVKPAKNRFAA